MNRGRNQGDRNRSNRRDGSGDQRKGGSRPSNGKEGSARKRDGDRPSYGSDRDRPERGPDASRQGSFKKREDNRPDSRKSGSRDGSFPKRDGDRPSYGRDNDRNERGPGASRQGYFQKREDDRPGSRKSGSRDGSFPKRDGDRPSYGRDNDRTERGPGASRQGSFQKREDDRPGSRKSGSRDSSFPKRDGDRPSYGKSGDRPVRGKGGPRDGGYQGKGKKFSKPRGKFAEDLSSKSEKEGIRLNKYLANAGVASRREADELIAAGLVTINGEVVTKMGIKVMPGDTVRYGGDPVQKEKKVYLLLNKPKGFITTMDDPKARKTVMDLVGNACKERIYPVGRLDRATTGVLMFTNDGELAKKLTHPSHGAKKIYQVVLNKNLAKADLVKISEGVNLEDGLATVDSVAYVEGKERNHIGMELHIGKNRIVRRIFESLGYEVIKLDRVFFAGLTKKNLKRGQYRFLDQKEINFLKML
ncbi:MAG: RNA-binding S4 domain-containing protein [Bacteroidota bacterium]|nr:RNA-binding S4 domain-containing protein [Bacteroidota bacterium]